MQQRLWWEKGIIYQIYPRSYQDSNDDGIGDLPGIIQRLDYVADLNVDAIWLSPIYPSPMHDFGYDVADYTNIHPMFGTMDDFDRLLAETHRRGLKLILDLVPNHTSDEHPWFIESRSSRENPKRDWYIWKDPAPGSTPDNPLPPNNWLSFFGGPAWTFDKTTGQFYLHQFVTQQPELNYRNPAVMRAMLENMRFWLDKGVDGFRVDVIWLMIKDALFRDNPVDPNWDGVTPKMRLKEKYTGNMPEVHGLIRQMRALLDQYDERMMVGEIYLPNEDLVKYYGTGQDECHLPFNFQLILTPWTAPAVRQGVDNYEAALRGYDEGQGWPNWVLGNHDQHRLATRVGRKQARVANMLLLTLRGTPTCYYGDEIGMADVPIPPEFIQDPSAVNQPEVADVVGRDPERTPMQWDDSPNAGFTAAGVQSWLPVGDDYELRNVASQAQDGRSFLTLFRTMTDLRRTEPALHSGDYASVDVGVASGEIFAYMRTVTRTGTGEDQAEGDKGDNFLIVLNMGGNAHTLDLSGVAARADIAVQTLMSRTGTVDLSALEVNPNEGLILRLLG